MEENGAFASGIFRLVLGAPRTAGCLEPGQFVHLPLPGSESRLLRRPFSVYRTDASNGFVEVVYQTVGAGTRFLAGVRPGTALDLVAPLGRGWQVPPGTRKALVVAGGVGMAPLNMLVARLLEEGGVHLVVGARSADCLVPLAVPVGVGAGRLGTVTVTDDGSAGCKGLTTDVTRELLQQEAFDYVATCGPEPMLRIVAELALAAGVPCEVSLERRMACGIGACLSCAVPTRTGLRRACADGPVFDAREVLW